MRNKAKIAPFF